MRRHLPRILAYLAFFLAAGILSFIVTFPAENLDGMVNRRIVRAGGGALRVEGSRYRFPLSLAAERLSVIAGGRRIELGRAVITPSLLSLAGKYPAWTVRLGGDWGEIPFSLVTGKTGPWRLSTVGGTVDLARHPALISLPLALEGKAAVSFSLSGVKGSLEGASGRGELVVTQGVAGGAPLKDLGLPSLRLSRLSLPLTLDRGILTLHEGKVEGDFIGTVSGASRLALTQPLLSSLDLALALRPSAETRGKLGPALALLEGAGGGSGGMVNLRVTGTWGQPALGLGSGPGGVVEGGSRGGIGVRFGR